MKRIQTYCTYHLRKDGGLFLGIRIDFKCLVICYDNSERWVSSVSFGLLVATFRFSFYSKPVNWRES